MRSFRHHIIKSLLGCPQLVRAIAFRWRNRELAAAFTTWQVRLATRGCRVAPALYCASTAHDAACASTRDRDLFSARLLVRVAPRLDDLSAPDRSPLTPCCMQDEVFGAGVERGELVHEHRLLSRALRGWRAAAAQGSRLADFASGLQQRLALRVRGREGGRVRQPLTWLALLWSRVIAWPAVRAGAGAALHTRREVQPRCGLAAPRSPPPCVP
jgi:hypothetical protein